MFRVCWKASLKKYNYALCVPQCGQQLGNVRSRKGLDLAPCVASAPTQLNMLPELFLPAQEGTPGSNCIPCLNSTTNSLQSYQA